MQSLASSIEIAIKKSFMSHLTRSFVQRYGFAVGVVGLALVVMLLLDPWLTMTKSPFLLFFSAVMVSAWYGGMESGLFATGLSAFISNYFFIAPLNSLGFDTASSVRLILFILQGIGFSALCEVLHRANRRLNLSLQSLAVSEERYRFIVDTANEGIWAIDREGQTHYVNQQLAEMFACTPEQMLGRSLLDFIDKSAYPQALQILERCKQGIREQFDFRYRRFDGSDLWAIVSTNPMLNEQGQWTGALAMLTDITDRKQAEQALQAASQQIANILESITDAFYTLDSQWRFTYVNVRCEQVFGRSREELLGGCIWELFPETIASVSDRQYRKAIAQQIPVTFETQLSAAGSSRWYEVRAYPSPDGLTVYLQDISGRKQAEQEIQKLNRELGQRVAELETLLEVMPAGIAIVHDTECSVIRANPFFRKLFFNVEPHSHRSATEQLEKLSCKFFQDGKELSVEELPLRQAARGVQMRNIELQILRSDGSQFDLFGSATPIFDHQGAARGCVAAFMDISGRKQVEVALKNSQERLRLAHKIGKIGTWEWHLQTERGVWTEELEALYGMAPGSFDGRYETWIESLHPDDRNQVHWQIVNTLTEGKDLEAEFRILLPNGSLRWLAAKAKMVSEDQGRVRRIVGVNMDITDRKLAEEALRHSEEQFRTALDNIPDIIALYDAERRLQFINAKGVRLSKRPLEKLIGRTDEELWPPEVTAQYLPLLEQAIATRTPQTQELTLVMPFGGPLTTILTYVPLLNQEGEIYQIVAISYDITERKQAQAALKASEERLRLALDAAALGMWDYDLRLDQLLCSERCKEIFGLPSEVQTRYQTFLNAVHPEDREQVTQAGLQAVNNRQEWNVEYRSLRPDGSIVWIAAIGRAYYDEQGVPMRMVGVVLDITARKQAEEALRQSETRLAYLAENVPGVIYQFRQFSNGTYDFPYISSGCLDLYELEPQAIQQQPQLVWEAIHPDDVAAFQQSLNCKAGTREQWRHEWRIITRSGQTKWLQAIARSEYHPQGFILWDGVLLDITERKRAEAERENLLAREQAARETAEAANRVKDEFLAVLSHELRTPLNPILGWAQVLRQRKLNEQAVVKALETIERNARLQIQLIDDLLDVSRILRGKLSLNMMPVNLEMTIQSALETVRLAAGAKSIQLQTQFEPQVGKVLGDAGRLQQVVWNLLSNAVKFTPSEGQVAIRLERSGDSAQITVRDSGLGITPEFLPYVFDYFRQADSTTARKFGGLGLGLAIVRHIVELHGGIVAAMSPGEGQGATFTVKLPLLKGADVGVKEVQGSSAGVDPQVLPLQGLQILVVDDELDTRELIAFVLAESGATVTLAASGMEALQLLEGFHPDLLISDIGMPEIDGYALIRQLRGFKSETGREMLAIALTAYAREDDRIAALKAGFQLHIPKPLEPMELVTAVVQLLAKSSAGSERSTVHPSFLSSD